MVEHRPTPTARAAPPSASSFEPIRGDRQAARAYDRLEEDRHATVVLREASGEGPAGLSNLDTSLPSALVC